MSDLPFVLVGWLGTAAVLAAYTGWIRSRMRKHTNRVGEQR